MELDESPQAKPPAADISRSTDASARVTMIWAGGNLV
jgi:hypothetical protein